MYADRYQRPKTSPTGLAAAIGVNAALIAALLTSAPTIFVPPETPLQGYAVPDDPPPPPPNPAPAKAEAETKTMPRHAVPDAPQPRVDLRVPTEGVIGHGDPPPIPEGPISGGGGTVIVDPPPVPAPVLVDAVPDPRFVRDFQPDYPPAERRAGNQGLIAVRVLVGADGRVKAVEPLRGASGAFFDATRRHALLRWRFRPATRDGIPVESWRTMTVRFVLEG